MNQQIENTTLKVVMGKFDGQNMIGEDGHMYPIPANYASKSKLVEGDELKLYVQNDGNMVYKQTLPIKRIRFIGEIIEEANRDERIIRILHPHTHKRYNVLESSVRYFKLEPGTHVAVITSKDSNWGAVEAVVKSAQEIEMSTPQDEELDER